MLRRTLQHLKYLLTYVYMNLSDIMNMVWQDNGLKILLFDGESLIYHNTAHNAEQWIRLWEPSNESTVHMFSGILLIR